MQKQIERCLCRVMLTVAQTFCKKTLICLFQLLLCVDAIYRKMVEQNLHLLHAHVYKPYLLWRCRLRTRWKDAHMHLRHVAQIYSHWCWCDHKECTTLRGTQIHPHTFSPTLLQKITKIHNKKTPITHSRPATVSYTFVGSTGHIYHFSFFLKTINTVCTQLCRQIVQSPRECMPVGLLKALRAWWTTLHQPALPARSYPKTTSMSSIHAFKKGDIQSTTGPLEFFPTANNQLIYTLPWNGFLQSKGLQTI